MDRKKSLTVAPARWSNEAAAILSMAMPFASSDDLRVQVDQGAVLFKVDYDGEEIGYYVLRVDQTASGAEGVLVAACGSLPGVDLTALLVPTVEKQFRGCKAMRIHTARKGLAKKLLSMGYSDGEIVLRKKLK